MSPALAGRFPTTVPPGKSLLININYLLINENKILSPFKKHNYVNISKAVEIIYTNCKIIVSITMKTGDNKKKNTYIHIEVHIYKYMSAHTYLHIYTEIILN